MRLAACIVAVLGGGFGCSFTAAEQSSRDAGTVSHDGPGTAAHDSHLDAHAAPVDSDACYGSGGLFTACFAAPPSSSLSIDSNKTTKLDTDGSDCVVMHQAGGPDVCVIAASTISINSDLRATGSRPLVLVAATTLELGATIDVSTHDGNDGAGADPTACGTAGAGMANNSGGGGGAGGTFGGKGGAGATGANGNGGTGGAAAALGTAPTFVRGGCAGADGGGTNAGTGGHGGGAIYLIAGTSISLNSSANIKASGDLGGGGAKHTGGGGAGAGGLIGLDAPAVSIDDNADVWANGGGGGEGGGDNDAGNDGNTSSQPDQAASGGNGNTNGGNGGDGGYGTHAAQDGGPDSAGGGGGGGGVGVIRIFQAGGAPSTGDDVSPPPS
jgi:hypothetical protein